MTRPSARAGVNPTPAVQPLPERKPDEPEPGSEHVAFAIKYENGQYTPVRLMLEGGVVVHEIVLHEGVNSEPLAYQYLAGDVEIEYVKRSSGYAVARRTQ